MDSLSRTSSFTIFSPNQPSNSPSFFCKFLLFAGSHWGTYKALIGHLLRKCHANSRVYRHFRRSVYSQFDKPQFFPRNCSQLFKLGPFDSVISRLAGSLLCFAQSLRPDGHIKRRGPRIASSDEANNQGEQSTLIFIRI